MIQKALPPFLLLALALCSCNASENLDQKNTDALNNHENSRPVQVVAHRGGARLAPENTLAAIRQAVDLGVDMIEIDVILSKDGEVIVIHDDKIDRTTDGTGVVKDMTLAEIRQYDAGSWFDPKFAGEKIPTLDEVFEAINGKSILLIEIKDGDEAYPGLEQKVVDAIHKYQAEDWVVVQSFNEQSVLRVKKMDAGLITYYLLGQNFVDFYPKLAAQTAGSSSSTLPYDGLAVHHSAVDSAKVATMHDAGYQVFVWTVNEMTDMKRTLAAGVDGIITDVPDALQELVMNDK